MTSKETEHHLEHLTQNLNPTEFIYDFLLAFGLPKASVSRLKKGDFNRSKVAGEILYKGKIFFKEGQTGNMLFEVEELSQDPRILKENPRIIFLTDYKNVVAKDLRTKVNREFPITDLPKYRDFFVPITGAEIYKSTNDNKADREASYALARFYDIVVQDNPELYKGDSHSLNILLSRLLFCFFAEDTGIFENEGMFTDAMANNTTENGSDLDVFFKDLFAKLNSRKSTHPSAVKDFPYVNGGLFKDEIKIPKFSKKSRDILLDCGNLNWDEINPDIFGSMIQAVADPEERSGLGMHYTSVPNILKLIKPLFLDELYEEFEKNRDNAKNLEKLLTRLSDIKFFDPACGSGNFLIITYKELRLLEIKIIQQLIDLENEFADTPITAQTKMNFSGKGDTVAIPPTQQKINFGGKQAKIYYPQIHLSQFYGIEIKDFAHEVAILSLWLAEHQMNKVFVDQLEGFGQTDPILPLKESGKITQGNAATLDWEKACSKEENDEIYIIGNPPYLGYSRQNIDQKNDLATVVSYIPNYKKLDYIVIWFIKATNYIKSPQQKYAFVSTNSITQGEQVSLLFPYILSRNQEIFFAHQSFKWQNNAKGNAGVAVIIVGIRMASNEKKVLFSENLQIVSTNINPYLINAPNNLVYPRNTPLSAFPEMIKGSSPGDNGNLLLDNSEREEILQAEPDAEKFIKKYIGAYEFMHSIDRYCIYVTDENLEDAHNISSFKGRFGKVADFRKQSTKVATQNKAKIPYFFDENKHREEDFLLIPQTGSERREYLPIGYFDKSNIVSNAVRVIYTSETWIFGVLSSKIHMVWIRAIAGRLKTDMQYSNTLCYNTFPFPEIPTKQKEIINQYVFAILDERAKFPQKTMAWLYNPDTMPKDLKNAHRELDEAIERCYRLAPFTSDAERLEYLFKMYDEMTKKDTLWGKVKKGKKKKNEI
ncbi:class I SAM-dependent DNA methyltransferase [Kaistella pullorum]|uniref:site-specific DNA-methyltransferase (adenine-specific) n=1 Tax=Kaistella pullorum TaxID=2763074 RepID=A0ABR8WQ70_9FLAO|nr:DNA methyltransferase [Kaistella pullorum]MBD8019087.1 class I SAM-dependent DNA methyltransferase [Kaistella pullorum]